MALKYADNAGTQLFDPMSETDVTVVVESVNSFPTGISETDPAVATIANDDNSLSEQVKITNIDRPTKTLTIVRGLYDSTPLDWPKGSKIEIRLSAGFMSEFETQLNAYTDAAVNAASTSGATNTTNRSKAAFATAFVLS